MAAGLIARESVARESSGQAESAALRVFKKLRESICVFAGTAAFESFAIRALSEAQSEVPSLRAVQVAEDGSLESVNDLNYQLNNDRDLADEEGTILIACLLDLLHIFLGEALTLSLLRDAWPDATSDDRSSGNGRKP